MQEREKKKKREIYSIHGVFTNASLHVGILLREFVHIRQVLEKKTKSILARFHDFMTLKAT
jgi:hypothetical protein